MTNSRLIITWAICLICFSTACNKDRAKEYNVPDMIEPYVEQFELDAADRGQIFDIDDLVVVFETDLELDGVEAAGICKYGNDNHAPTVSLDTFSVNWQVHSYSREQLVYHELGHCVLDRGHDAGKLKNGNPRSLMKPDGDALWSSFNFFKRDYYLDELFDENTPGPAWAEPIPYNSISLAQKESVFEENFTNNQNEWYLGPGNTIRKIENGYYHFENNNDTTSFYISRALDWDTSRDFEIEIGIKTIQGSSLLNSLMWGFPPNSEFYYFGYSQTDIIGIGWRKESDFVAQEKSSLLLNDFNKLTVRKQGDLTHFYVNGVYFDLITSNPFSGKEIGILLSSNSTIHIDYLNLSYLNL